MYIGGIAGSLGASDPDAGWVNKRELFSAIDSCVNFGEISGKGTYFLGGTCGEVRDYCKHLASTNCNTTGVKWNGESVTDKTGTSPNYVGTGIGYRGSNVSVTYIAAGSYYNNVYEVINGMSNTESTIWSNSNVDEPTLLWETTIK